MNEQSDMAEPPTAVLSADELEAKRISRRAAIKKAAAVAGAVWVAPTIIDSLASPAAAVSTVTKGCLQVEFDPLGSGNSCDNRATAPGTPQGTFSGTPCSSPVYMGGTDTTNAISVSPSGCKNTTAAITYSIRAGVDCTFVAAAGTDGTNSSTVTGTFPNKTFIINKPTNNWSRINIYLTCV